MRKFVLTPGVLIAVFVCGSCTNTPPSSRYEPHRHILTVIAEVSAFRDYDIYRHKPPTDPAGRNIYRALLDSLIEYEKRYPDKFNLSIQFAKALCYEKLREYTKAGDSYLEVLTDRLSIGANPSTATRKLLAQAEERLKILKRFLNMLSKKPQEETLSSYIDFIKSRIEEFKELAVELRGSSYEPLAMLEKEEAEEKLALLLLRERHRIQDGTRKALLAISNLIESNPHSARRYSHQLMLADAYYGLALDYERGTPDEEFRMFQFDALVDSAARIYYAVSRADGYPEKHIARGKLQALLAYARSVREAHR